MRFVDKFAGRLVALGLLAHGLGAKLGALSGITAAGTRGSAELMDQKERALQRNVAAAGATCTLNNISEKAP